MLGGPFFTTVPSGRVGQSKEFTSNEAFVQALRAAEKNDVGSVTRKMAAPQTSNAALQNVGVTRLRTFLEARVEDCYRRNVAKIVPLLQSELRHAESKLASTEQELAALSIDRLKQSANIYRERFAKELANSIHGTVKANPEEWDRDVETLQVEREERTRCEPEQAVAPGRAMPLAMGKDGQEGEGDRAAEERDDCW
jgi:hypothetical protein